MTKKSYGVNNINNGLMNNLELSSKLKLIKYENR